MVLVINLWGYRMNSIKNLLVSQILKYIIIIFVSTIFLLNIAFYVFSNNQYLREIERQYTALYNMTAHLAAEEDIQTLEVYLEHYTHTNEVLIQFNNAEGQSVFSNDQDSQLDKYEAVYYDESLVGYLAVNFEPSMLSKDILSGFIGLNFISITLFALGVYILFKFFRKESNNIRRDLSHIGIEGSIFSYKEINQIHTQLTTIQEQKDKQRIVYESHIKSLAHDIKTPLTVIRIYTDSLVEGNLMPTKDILVDLREETMKISDLLPKFIEPDYVELPYLQDISLFIERYVNKYREVFDSKQITIETRLEPLALSVSDKDIGRLIEHLTFNAFYYSNPHSAIKISTHKDSQLFIIEDEGIGMSEETIDRITKGPYRSKEAMLLNEKGSGIGFQVINEIVQKLGATIHLESGVGRGTKISICFSQKK